MKIIIVLLACVLQCHCWDDLNPDDREHIVLPEEETAGKRVFIVGDVHGCYDEMMTLLRDADMLNDDEDDVADDAVLIFVGDIINKGPKNLEVLHWVMNSRAYTVTGNHEVNVLEKGDQYEWPEDLEDEDIEYLQNIPWTVTVEEWDFVIVHAGLIPDKDLEDQDEFTMTRVRNLEYKDGEWIPHDDRKEGDNWAYFWEGPGHVPYGHDAGRGKDDDGNPIIQEHDEATGLDSRCVYGGLLSGLMKYPNGDDEYFQTECEEYDSYKVYMETRE